MGFYKNINAEVQTITNLSQTIEVGHLYKLSGEYLSKVLENMHVDSTDEIPDDNPSKLSIIKLSKITDDNTYVMLKEMTRGWGTTICQQCFFHNVFGLCLQTNCSSDENILYAVKKVK